MFRDGEQVRMSTMVVGITIFDKVDFRYVTPEYVVAPPDVGEKPPVIKEPRQWFWQKKKVEKKD
jgi:hypothetical protein